LLTYSLPQLNKNDNILKEKVTVLFSFHIEKVVKLLYLFYWSI